MEMLLQRRLQVRLDHRLRNAIRNRWNTQRARPAISLGDIHTLDWRRKVAPRRQPIPQLVEIPFQVLLKLFD